MTNENGADIDIYAAMAEGRRLRALAVRDAYLSLAAIVKRAFGAATSPKIADRATEA